MEALSTAALRPFRKNPNAYSEQKDQDSIYIDKQAPGILHVGLHFLSRPYFDVFYFLARSNDISMKKMEEKYDDYKIIS